MTNHHLISDAMNPYVGLGWLLAHPLVVLEIQTGISLGRAHTSSHRVSVKDHFDENTLCPGNQIQLALIS